MSADAITAVGKKTLIAMRRKKKSMVFQSFALPPPYDMDLNYVLSMVAASESPMPVIDTDWNYQGIIDKKILLQTLNRAG